MHRGSRLCFSMACLLKSSHCLAMPFQLVSFRVASPPFHIKAGRLRSALCRRDAMWLVSHRCHAVAPQRLSIPFHVQASDICSLLIPAIADHIVSSLTARSLSIADRFASYRLDTIPWLFTAYPNRSMRCPFPARLCCFVRRHASPCHIRSMCVVSLPCDAISTLFETYPI